MDLAYSVNGTPIRLTYERWYHIVENHDELASYFHEVLDTVSNPDLILRGNKGCLKAARNLGSRKWIVVVYREISKDDGFVITAYLLGTKPKGEVIWPD
ncbi:MAG TPA: hypothetical protein PLY86_19475 [bacterium]|nr:hypothetical protein [bacterium]